MLDDADLTASLRAGKGRSKSNRGKSSKDALGDAAKRLMNYQGNPTG